MNTPTWSDLARLLNSDPASDEWAAEVLTLLKHQDGDVQTLIECTVDEAQEALSTMGYDEPEMTDADELTRLASIAKRGAVKMLHTAFAAEQALGKIGAAS